MALTKREIEQAKPSEKKRIIWDKVIPGFGVMVMPSGTKTFYVRYWTQIGTQRWTRLGRFPTVTLEQAKRAAREVLASVEEGKDPEMERKRRRSAPDLYELAAKYMDEHGSRKKSGFNDEILWRKHLLPHLGSVRVACLEREQVRLFHADHPRPVTANRALEVLGRAMALAEEWGWRPVGSNPCQGVKAHPERQRRRYLDESELRRLRHALVSLEQTSGSDSVRWRFAKMVRLLLLTGARLRELMEAEWDWVKWNQGLIEIPPEAHKTGMTGTSAEPKELVLSGQALEVLRELWEERISDRWVVAGALPDRPLNGYRKMWLALLEEARIVDFRLHDLRHTFASYGLSNGVPLEVVGALLGHRSTQTTLRYSHLVRDRAHEAASMIAHSMS